MNRAVLLVLLIPTVPVLLVGLMYIAMVPFLFIEQVWIEPGAPGHALLSVVGPLFSVVFAISSVIAGGRALVRYANQ